MTPEQSPIDLGPAVPCEQPELTIDYRLAVMHGHDKRTTLEFPVAGGSTIQYGDHRYELVQFHFHTPSEHEIDGESVACEVHFVHKDAHGRFAVLAVFIDESDASRGPRNLEQAVAMKSLLPASTTHYAYDGSLTTPPYTEGVQWIVLTDRVSFHSDWVDAFRDRYGANNRPIQPLSDRTITLS